MAKNSRASGKYSSDSASDAFPQNHNRKKPLLVLKIIIIPLEFSSEAILIPDNKVKRFILYATLVRGIKWHRDGSSLLIIAIQRKSNKMARSLRENFLHCRGHYVQNSHVCHKTRIKSLMYSEFFIHTAHLPLIPILIDQHKNCRIPRGP